MSESKVRIIINKLLKDSGWILFDDYGVVNVDTEMHNQAGRADFVLKDNSVFPICIIKAKKELVSPLVGKEQTRGYAESLNCRFVVLSNGISHYFWDIEQGSPIEINAFTTLEQLVLRKSNFNPPRQETEDIGEDYIALTQIA